MVNGGLLELEHWTSDSSNIEFLARWSSPMSDTLAAGAKWHFCLTLLQIIRTFNLCLDNILIWHQYTLLRVAAAL